MAPTVRSEKTKRDFIKYLENHPDERFWQAVRNFANVPFVYTSKELYSDGNLQDTFYIEELKR